MKKLNLTKFQIIAILLILVCIASAIPAGIGISAHQGSSPAEARDGVVYIQQLLRDSSGNLVAGGSGTGWAIGKPGEDVQYFVTNGHVVQYAHEVPKQDSSYVGEVDIYYSAAENDFVKAEVVFYSASDQKDIAILKAPTPTNKRKALVIRDADTVTSGDPANALGYPGVSDTLQSNVRYDVSDITMTSGVVSKRVSLSFAEYEAFQTDTSINPGNSGGPLVDENGYVIGINSSSLIRNLDDSGDNTMSLGVNYAITSAELVRILNTEGMVYTMKGEKDWMMYVFGAIAALALIGAIVLFILSGRQKGSAPAGKKVKGAPVLHGTSGKYAGQSIKVGSGGVTIGRNPSSCNLLYEEGTPGISGVHCQVIYDSGQDCFFVTDKGSSYGTFLGSGQKLTPNVAVRLAVGEEFYIGSAGNRFTVTKE